MLRLDRQTDGQTDPQKYWVKVSESDSLDQLLTGPDEGARSSQIKGFVHPLDKWDEILANETEEHLETLIAVGSLDQLQSRIHQMVFFP